MPNENYAITIHHPDTGRESKIPLRFFIYDENEPSSVDDDGNPAEYGDLRECSLEEFEAADGEITYERDTVRENGVAQVCLTKMPRG